MNDLSIASVDSLSQCFVENIHKFEFHAKIGGMTPDPQQRITLNTTSVEGTEFIGEYIGKHAPSGVVICLSGTLGAGKTSITRGIARGWGAIEQPTSPTFTLINVYQRHTDEQRFYHIDCYRLAGPDDAISAGIDDIWDTAGIAAIEWPERIRELLPDDLLWLEMKAVGETHRTLTFKAAGERSAALLRKLPSVI